MLECTQEAAVIGIVNDVGISVGTVGIVSARAIAIRNHMEQPDARQLETSAVGLLATGSISSEKNR